MPSTSPGNAPTSPSSFVQILPGAPNSSLQSLTIFIFRHKRYITYISGRQINLLSSPTTLVQALTFDEELVAIAAEIRTGKVAVASKKQVWVLEPVTEGWTKVWWQKALLLAREDAGDEANWLSWGNDGEVLVGGSRSLSLFSTLPSSRTSAKDDAFLNEEETEERKVLWSKSVSSPIEFSAFSPSGSIIATCGPHDRLVKIWRRLSFEDGLFDYTYLPHPGAVTHLQWRPFDLNPDQNLEAEYTGILDEEMEALYTIANDGILRLWRTGGINDLDILVLHTSLDLVSAIPQSPSVSVKDGPHNRPNRYAFMVPDDQFDSAAMSAIGLKTEKISNSLEHLKEVSQKVADVIVTLDGHGRMSAWGLQSVGHKRRPETPSGTSKEPFHIAHAERMALKIAEGSNANFDAWFEGRTFNVLVHSFGGYVQWWCGDVERFFSPSGTGSELVQEAAYWSGHSNGPITSLAGSINDQAMLTCSDDGEIAYWMPTSEGILQNTAVYSCSGKVLDLAFISCPDQTRDCALLLESSTSDPREVNLVVRDSSGAELDRKSHDLDSGDESALWRLFGPVRDCQSSRFVALNNYGRGFTFTTQHHNCDLPKLSDLQKISTSAGTHNDSLLHTSVILDVNDVNKIGFVGITSSGVLQLYHLQLAQKVVSEPSLMAKFESDVTDACILAVNNEFAAVVSSDRISLAIVDLRDGYVEHRHSMGGEIKHIVPSPKDNLVAVAYDTSINILAQGRYEHQGEMPPWTIVKQVSIADIGLTISALAWRGDGSLAVAAGNGIFLTSNDVPVEELHQDVQEAIDAKLDSRVTRRLTGLARQLKKPLPMWHPSLVAHTVRHGHWALASNLARTLLGKLKFWSEGDPLHPLLDVPAEHLYGDLSATETAPLDESLITELMQQLDEKDLPEVSQSEQERLKRVLQAMKYCSQHVDGLDNGALRFLFSWKLEILHMESNPIMESKQPNGISHIQASAVPEMHWREIAFAYHSTSQQPLLDILVTHYDNKITWDIARRLGLFAWLHDREALDQIFEALAQSAYRATSPPDPINASLFFLALHKKPTLIALWRIATWQREQRTTMNFLKRDFSQSANKTAARKNAYALMGKKRFEYAAAFFLLADDAQSAVSVLASQCGDVMLAIAVARLYSGDGSSVLRKLLEDRLMPQARQTGDRWLMSWCHSILYEKDEAADALVKPLEGVRTWQQDDPNTLTLYRNLRRNESEHEYDAIVRAARILRRMGLWLLALELVSQWKFNTPRRLAAGAKAEEPITNGVYEAAPSTLDSFTDLAKANDAPSMLDGFNQSPQHTPPVEDEKAAREAKAAELLQKIKAKKQATPIINEKKPEPTQFKEPDANSLLNSFGF